MFLLHWKFYRTLFSVHRIYNYRKNVNDFHILVKSILVPFSTFWHASLIKVRRRWKIFRKKLNRVEIRHVLYFCVLMKTIVMVKILSGIIICLIAYFIFLYCSNSSCAFLHDWKKNKYNFGYFLKNIFWIKIEIY